MLALLLWSTHASAQETPDSDNWRQSPPQGIAVGDLVFRKGQGTWTKYFIASSLREKRFSHVGIVVSVEDGKVRIVHADANDYDGVGQVRTESWRGFHRKSLEGAVYRYTGPDAERARPLFAEKGLEKIGVPFDSSFDLETEDTLYCTEFVRWTVNTVVERPLIGESMLGGRRFIPIDGVYEKDFKKIWDSVEE